MLLAVCHSVKSGWTRVEDLSTISELRAAKGNILWAEADIATVDGADAALLQEEFGLHPLALDDALRTRQRPKLEAYDRHLFLALHQLDEVDDQLEASQLACFVGDGYLLTLHEGASRILEEAKRRWDAEGCEPRLGAAHLVHTLLDVLVDDFEVIIGRLEDEVEDLEDIVLASPQAPVQRQLYGIKQHVSRLRRYALPTERVLAWIVEGHDENVFPAETKELFADVNDHILRAGGQIRNVDDLADAVIEFMRASQTQALNEVTKRLTGWAAIIAVPTFIASVYGMNFDLVPAEDQLFGFFFSLALMIAASLALYIFFKRRDWI